MNDAESGLCFIDSNVWLYAFVQAQAQDRTAKARTLVQSSQVVISSQVINEVCFNLIKKVRFDEVSIRSLIESFYGKYHVAGIGREVLLKGSQLRHSPSLFILGKFNRCLCIAGRGDHCLLGRYAVRSSSRGPLADN